MLRALSLLTYVVVSLSFAGVVQALAGDEFTTLIENVRANEHLYDNIEMRLEYRMRTGNPTKPIPETVKSGLEKKLYVRQGGLVRNEDSDSYLTIAGKSSASKFDLGYDGETMRMVRDGNIANISDGPYDDVIASPHTLILRKAFVAFPLSVYLAGGNALHSFASYRNRDVQASYIGEDVVDGFHCSKVLVETAMKGRKASTKRYLWLAHERNELPVRSVGYALNYSAALPIEDVRVTRFEEIKKGIWYPMGIQFTVYDELPLREGKTIVSNTLDIVTKAVDLNPKYPREFFQDIKIPDGAQVYVIKDKEIVKSYIQGKPKVEAPPKGAGFPVMLAAGGLLSAVTACAALWFAHHKKVHGKSVLRPASD